MEKQKLTLSIDNELIEKAKEEGLQEQTKGYQEMIGFLERCPGNTQ